MHEYRQTSLVWRALFISRISVVDYLLCDQPVYKCESTRHFSTKALLLNKGKFIFATFCRCCYEKANLQKTTIDYVSMRHRRHNNILRMKKH